MQKWHKWLGLIFSVIFLPTAISGILLNHRHLIAPLNISRAWMPDAYRIRNYNNGVIRGACMLPDSSGQILYGSGGCYLHSFRRQEVMSFNRGLPNGLDYRRINRVVQRGNAWYAMGTFQIYMRPMQTGGSEAWHPVSLPPGADSRMADIAVHGDSLLLLTQSELYLQPKSDVPWQKIELQTPSDKVGQPKRVSLFSMVWQLHSGEAFGLPGRLIVDFIGICIILLCFTGIVYFILPHHIRRLKRRGADAKGRMKRAATQLRRHLSWHNRIGSITIALTLFIALTGMFLRPPLMIPLVMTHVPPIPFSAQDHPDYWHRSLRLLTEDPHRQEWILGTTGGFFTLPMNLNAAPKRIVSMPPVSPMGANVLRPIDREVWLVGSFSGLFLWNRTTGKSVDYFTRQKPPERGRPISNHLITGSTLNAQGEIQVADYSRGLIMGQLPPMPKELKQCGMSLWGFALELHVGRCYEPLLGPLSVLYVFLSGLLLFITLLTGYLIYRRQHRHKRKH